MFRSYSAFSSILDRLYAHPSSKSRCQKLPGKNFLNPSIAVLYSRMQMFCFLNGNGSELVLCCTVKDSDWEWVWSSLEFGVYGY